MDAMVPPDPDPAFASAMPDAGQPVPPPPVPSVTRPPAAMQRIGWRTGIALGILAFLAGLAVTALVAVRFGASFATAPAKSVATVTLPVEAGGQAPLLIVPGKAAAAPALDLAALSGREGALAARIADLEARAAGIDRASAQASGYATRAEGLMIAFAARRALDRGLNLGFLEDQLHARFGASAPHAVATVVQTLHEPVTLEDLRTALDGVAPELMTGAASTGWWPSLRRELGNLVILRRAGTPSPLPVDRVARARRLLEAGSVEAALAEVARTPGAPQAERWTLAARRYVAARAALDTIEASAILTPDTAVPVAGPAPAAPAPGPAVAPTADVPGLGATPPNR